MLDNPTVQVAKCPKCGKAVKMVVSAAMDRASSRELAKLMEQGCEMATFSLEEARKAKMCFMNCK